MCPIDDDDINEAEDQEDEQEEDDGDRWEFSGDPAGRQYDSPRGAAVATLWSLKRQHPDKYVYLDDSTLEFFIADRQPRSEKEQKDLFGRCLGRVIRSRSNG